MLLCFACFLSSLVSVFCSKNSTWFLFCLTCSSFPYIKLFIMAKFRLFNVYHYVVVPPLGSFFRLQSKLRFLGLPSSFFRPSPDRNQFRVQLTGVIECTAVLFEHLVELTQGLDEAGCVVFFLFDMGALLMSPIYSSHGVIFIIGFFKLKWTYSCRFQNKQVHIYIYIRVR